MIGISLQPIADLELAALGMGSEFLHIRNRHSPN